MDTYIEVQADRGLPSKTVTAASSKTVSRTLNSVTISQAGVYDCSARVFYNGTLSNVTNSVISSVVTATLRVTSEILSVNIYIYIYIYIYVCIYIY